MEELGEVREDEDVFLKPEEFSGTGFTPQEKRVFEDALTLGCRSKVVDVFGHQVKIRTTTIREDLQIAEIIRPFENTKGLLKAYKTASVAASIEELDGEVFYTPISPQDQDELVLRKYQKLLDYYSLFVDQVAKEVTALVSEVEKSVIDKLGKSQG